MTSKNDPATEEDRLVSVSRLLAVVARELGLGSIASQIESDATRRLDTGRLRVLVLGEIKHGKSSLINALVGTPLLPVGVTPTTGAIVSVRAETQPGRFLVDPSGSRRDVDASRFDRLARGEE